jgi:hypothetical protein
MMPENPSDSAGASLLGCVHLVTGVVQQVIRAVL